MDSPKENLEDLLSKAQQAPVPPQSQSRRGRARDPRSARAAGRGNQPAELPSPSSPGKSQEHRRRFPESRSGLTQRRRERRDPGRVSVRGRGRVMPRRRFPKARGGFPASAEGRWGVSRKHEQRLARREGDPPAAPLCPGAAAGERPRPGPARALRARTADKSPAARVPCPPVSPAGRSRGWRCCNNRVCLRHSPGGAAGSLPSGPARCPLSPARA